MSDLLAKLETHAKLGLAASPGFFLSTEDLREIVRVMKSNEGLRAVLQDIADRFDSDEDTVFSLAERASRALEQSQQPQAEK